MYCEDTQNKDSYLYNLYAHRALISYKISDNKIVCYVVEKYFLLDIYNKQHWSKVSHINSITLVSQ